MPFSAAPADVPYAYVVDYRPLDACSPPQCRLKGEELVGWWDEIQNDGSRGSYARIGNPRSELYFRRAKVLRPGKEYEFELEPTAGEHDYDGYFGSPDNVAWKAQIEVATPDGRVLAQLSFDGTSQQTIDAQTVAEMAHYADFFSHVRWTLPPRDERLTVTIRNDGPGSLAIGSPLVLEKVIGRRARQAIFVVSDAVQEPLMSRMLTGSGDEQTAWLSRAVRERGTLFARGISPAFNSPTFIRRFFRSGFYEIDGELALFGQGIDEQAPLTPPSPVSRLVDRGFQAELTVANFMLLPTQTRIGFDGGYHNEQQRGKKPHPRALVRRFESWISEHPHDDALHIVWFSATHAPYPPGREAPPFELGAPGVGHSQKIVDATWRNLLETVDRISELMASASRSAPDTQRIWLVTADHGTAFTDKTLGQPEWLLPNQITHREGGHCCFGSSEEAATPFAVIYDGASRVTPARVDELTSSVAVWRLLEHAYQEDLELPNTTSYDSPAFDAEAYRARWNEGLVASAGNSGSIRAAADRWAFRSLLIRPQVGPVFAQPTRTQLALTGSPNRGEYFLAEELYDREADPFEQRNVADENESTVLQFRRKVADWLAVYYDPPNHPRYEYTLSFPHPVEVTLSSPVQLRVAVDGAAQPTAPAHRVALKGTSFVIQPDAEATSIIDLEGVDLAGFVRCSATGLPLEPLLGGGRVRFNLAIARTNCLELDGAVELSPADVGFRAKLVQQAQMVTGGGLTQELVDGLRSWGYVRDLDQAHGAKGR